MILVRVPCSSSACLVTRKLSAPAQNRSEGSKVIAFYQENNWYFSHHRHILFWIQFHGLSMHLLRARSATSTVMTSSLFMVSLESVRRENEEAFKAYLTLSTRVRHCHTFLHSCVADRFVLLFTIYVWRVFSDSFHSFRKFFLLGILLNIQLTSVIFIFLQTFSYLRQNLCISKTVYTLSLSIIEVKVSVLTVFLSRNDCDEENRVRGTTVPTCLYRSVDVLTCCPQSQSALCGR